MALKEGICKKEFDYELLIISINGLVFLYLYQQIEMRRFRSDFKIRNQKSLIKNQESNELPSPHLSFWRQ